MSSSVACASSTSSTKTGSSSSRNRSEPKDPYYGYAEVSQTVAKFICALFACPFSLSDPTQSEQSQSLALFVAYALHRTRLPQSVTFAGLMILSRLKERFPAARGSSGNRLFLTAFMIASKALCDDTYSNKSWCIVGQGLFSLRELNQMEREMAGYLEWKLNFKGEQLAAFEYAVIQQFGSSSHLPSPPLSKTDFTSLRTSVAVVAPSQQQPQSCASAAYPSPPNSPPHLATSETSSAASTPLSSPLPASVATMGNRKDEGTEVEIYVEENEGIELSY